MKKIVNHFVHKNYWWLGNTSKYFNEPGIINKDNSTFSYECLFNESIFLSSFLQETNSVSQYVGVLADNSNEYVSATWAIWNEKKVVVPFSPLHPNKEIEYIIGDAGIENVLFSSVYKEKVLDLQKTFPDISFIEIYDTQDENLLKENQFDIKNKELIRDRIKEIMDDEALIMYTSGTTGRPKGVVHTHSSLIAQTNNLSRGWKIKENDIVLHCLPLHHIHGIVNALYTTLSVNGKTKFVDYDPKKIWDDFMSCSVFHSVPTIYTKLIQFYEKQNDEVRSILRKNAKNMRLFVSGSASLPTPVFEKWNEITGHRLLERYGMTEIGMGLSNPLEPIEERLAGTIGRPFENFEVKIVPSDECEQFEGEENVGELYIKGEALFSGYLNKEEETLKNFSDEWFMTGDVVSEEKGVYKILGRISQDIIKSSGYKISALEIERVILGLDNIAECSVVGKVDEIWGEVVVSVLVVKDKECFSRTEFLNLLKKELAPYKIPKVVLLVDEIPKNQMGKVTKKSLLDSIDKL